MKTDPAFQHRSEIGFSGTHDVAQVVSGPDNVSVRVWHFIPRREQTATCKTMTEAKRLAEVMYADLKLQ